MLILRLLIFIFVALLVLSGAMYVIKRDPRWLTFAWQIIRFAVYILLASGLFYVLERFVLTGWKVLL
ncbi:MAG: hypothetical protein R8M11_07495 [Gallionella sp.]